MVQTVNGDAGSNLVAKGLNLPNSALNLDSLRSSGVVVVIVAYSMNILKHL